MALPVAQQLKYWGIAAAVLVFVLWLLGDVIMPFLLGGALAYVLDPVADRLEKLGLSRVLSVTLITLGSLVFFIVMATAVIPTLIEQATALIAAAPQVFARLQASVSDALPDLMDGDGALASHLARLGEAVQSRAGALLQTVLNSAAGFVNVLVLIVIVPVVTFYLLLDWDRMIAQVDELLPREHAPTIRMLAQQIDRTLASFIRGQGTVCVILGLYYSIALALVGLNFGFVIGAIAGALTFIPYVGALVGGGLAIGMALFQFWGEWWWIVIVWAIFQSGQFVEGNILTPKLVGSSVGLHPVWLIFALSVFGALFGFVGLLVAVPVAAVIGVLTRFGIGHYRQSQLYKGPQPGELIFDPERRPPGGS